MHCETGAKHRKNRISRSRYGELCAAAVERVHRRVTLDTPRASCCCAATSAPAAPPPAARPPGMDIDAGAASASQPSRSAPIPIPGAHSTPKKKEVARLAADAASTRALPPGLVRSLVLSYLLRNCYRRTALAFVAADDAAAPRPDPAAMSDAPRPALSPRELDQLDQRRAMMDRVLAGDVLAGVDIADRLLARATPPASVVSAFPMVYLRLLCQHFVELVRARRTIDALSFAQRTIAPLGKVNPAGLPLLRNYLPLLAYHEPELSPIFELVDKRHRETLAEDLNDHVFSYLHHVQTDDLPPRVERQSELERLMRHLSLLMNKLGEKEEGPKWTLARVIADTKDEEE